MPLRFASPASVNLNGSMLKTTLDRPEVLDLDLAHLDQERLSRTGSYVDVDGWRSAGRVGSYVGGSRTAVGSYTDRDGVRTAGRVASYTRTQR